MDEPDIATASRPHRGRKSRNGRSSKRKRSPKSRGLRPQRRAARNALTFFSKIGASTEDEEDYSEGSSSDSELNTDSTEAEQLEWNGQLRFSREEDVTQPSQFADNKGNSGTSRKLVLRIPLTVPFPLGSGKAECSTQDKAVNSFALADHESIEPELTVEHGHSSACKAELMIDGNLRDGSAVHSNKSIRWGEVKMRSSKRCKYSDPAGGLRSTSNNAASQDIEGSGSQEMPHEYNDGIQQNVGQNVQEIQPGIILDNIQENHSTYEYNAENFGDKEKITNDNNACADGANNTVQVHNTSQPSLKLKFKSKGFADGATSSDKSRSAAVGNAMNAKHGKGSVQHEDDSSINQSRNVDLLNASKSSQECTDKRSGLHDSKKLQFDFPKMCTAVYKRSKPKNRKKMDSDEYANDDSTSISNDDEGYQPPEYSPVTAASGRLRRSTRKSYAHHDDDTPWDEISQVKDSYSSYEASTSGRRIVTDVRAVMWRPPSKTVGLRSSRNRRESSNFPDTHPLGKQHQTPLKYSWLMLLEHEDSYRYIPQLGDEVVYLRQVMLF